MNLKLDVSNLKNKGAGRGLRQWGKASLRQGWKTIAKCLLCKNWNQKWSREGKNLKE